MRLSSRVSSSCLLALAIVVFGIFTAQSYSAPNAAPADMQRAPITVYTQGADVPSSRRLESDLLKRAREEGELPVIVGLRMKLRNEDDLSATERRAQRRSLRGMQERVAGRVLGRTLDAVKRYRFIPFMALFANEAQLRRLLADPDVTSIQEQMASAPQLKDSIPLIHADDVEKEYGVSGVGQVVAVVDTGVSKSHPMLLGKVVSEACYSTQKPTKKIASLCPGGATATVATGSGRNCPVSLPNCFHGTHAAAIAAGNPVGSMRGVASGAQIIAIQVFSRYNKQQDCDVVHQPAPCVRYLDQDLVFGLERVYQLRGKYKIAAVNISLGGRPLFSSNCDESFPAFADIFGRLRGAGIAPVAAAGNYGDKNSVAQPSCVKDAITVGATTKADFDKQVEHLAGNGDGNSDYGKPIELMAPGAHIRAAVPNGSTCIFDGTPYCSLNGTSEAAPHVAGAFAILRQTRPNASVDDMLEALECSGKTVEWPEPGDGVVGGLPKPRIDLLGAYIALQKPSDAKRSWDFDEAADALDWTPFVSTWLASGGEYVPKRIPRGVVLSSTANCNKSLEVVAKMRRVYPEGQPGDEHVGPTAGVLLKSKLDYPTRKISGYYFGYVYLPRFPIVEERGIAFIQRIDENSSTVLCKEDTDVPVNYRESNTIRAVSDGSAHKLYLNGKLMCETDDATYESGPVSVATGFSDDYPTTGGSFAVESVTIKSKDPPKLKKPNALALLPSHQKSLPRTGPSIRLSFPTAAF